MSKALEALQQIKASHFQVHIESENIADFDIWFENYYNLLLKALTPPTADELCKALSEWSKENMSYLTDCKVYYDDGGFYYNDNIGREIYLVDYNERLRSISFPSYVSSHLITMIGKFYEGLEK